MGELRLSHFYCLSLLLREAEEDLTFSAFAKGDLAYALREKKI